MNAQQIVDTIQNEKIGSVIFRYSQGKDSTVGGAGLSGVCEGMCYNFVRAKLFQPNVDSKPADSFKDFERKRAAGEAAGGVFVKDQSKDSPVELRKTEQLGERQAASGVRFSQAARNLDAKFKQSLSDKAKIIIADSARRANDPFPISPLSQYTKNLAEIVAPVVSHMEERDSIAASVFLSEVTQSYLAPLLSRDKVKETFIMASKIPIKELVPIEKGKQTSETLGQLLARDIEECIKKEKSPNRILAICEVFKQQSGHAIALEVLNPDGPITVLDPNFGLIKYQTWKEFEQGFGKMWQLYQVSYDSFVLRRYRCIDPHREHQG